jgi:crotonobetainyl-CoA:carnitine CoA-transferase CaiB-like acyl-CoA transferase
MSVIAQTSLGLIVIVIYQLIRACRGPSFKEVRVDQDALPLAGITVIEFTHMVMGPSVGVILADLGADVIKVEPHGGDATRRLLGSGAGYFPMFNRNKRSICLDLKSEAGLTVARRLCAGADIVVENFRPGTLDRLGLGYAALSQDNPGLIHCAAKGFLKGPYEKRTALDEVTQMMGGLAYMTGPPGRPLRAGASVIDIAGGMFGVIGVLAALERRHRTGRGGEVKCALFETTAFLVGQHMAQMAVTGQAAQPMPVRISAWAIYDVFETANEGEQLFVGVVSDAQWVAFCAAFGLDELGADPALARNNARVLARDAILPHVRALFAAMDRAALVAKLETVGLPFAPIARPDELFDDPHLTESGGLMDVTVPGGAATRLPGLPIEFDGERAPLRRDIPEAGADGAAILRDLGYDEDAITALTAP